MTPRIERIGVSKKLSRPGDQEVSTGKPASSAEEEMCLSSCTRRLLNIATGKRLCDRVVTPSETGALSYWSTLQRRKAQEEGLLRQSAKVRNTPVAIEELIKEREATVEVERRGED